MTLRLGLVHRLAERYRKQRAFLTTCPCCRSRYLRAPVGVAHVKPCPTCEAPLLSIGHIGIDQAAALIAANRRAA